ncbi:response regulator transcription factor [Pseudolysobacter antarcticus]|uniref:Response regulator transcription factor n=1 Tax=Pseudolysobacter antarcticus TaxID=2511995 RepID=A0A411HGA8_9GAMM|nr:response regulator transcription factor [Pseudolysobacter antarcticus]QBB69556.1 response regulator transcription factor [Pseudolysobacter antarcticus]
MRILLVEDDAMIGRSVQRGLTQDGMTVDWLMHGDAVERALQDHAFDALLLDLGLPGKSGLQIIRETRGHKNPLPILVITAQDAIEDRIAGLDAGADDYLTKPFDLNELAARLRALARRASGRVDPQIEHGSLRLNPASHEVTLREQPVLLSAREFAVLHALLERPGHVLSRAKLEEKLYGWGHGIDSNAIEVHIHALRKKLGQSIIRNVRGVGYVVDKVVDKPA